MVYIAMSFRRRQLRDKPLDLLYSVVVVFLFFMQPIALRLVCHGDAARWESASIQHLTHSASFHTSGLNFLADGKHDAVFVAEVRSRDVYRMFAGYCHIVTDSNSLSVSCLLTSYEGVSLDRLMQMHFALPYNHTTAGFFVTAYQELASRFIILGTEGVGQGVLSRRAFNSCLDSLFDDIEQQCASAAHESWHFFCPLIGKYFKSFFKNTSQLDLETVRMICLKTFRRLWRDVSRRKNLSCRRHSMTAEVI